MALSKLKNILEEGARPNKYRITMTPKVGNANNEQIDILAKSTSLPEVTMGVISVWNQGRKLQIAGDVSYGGTWDVVFYNTANLGIRKIMEDWIKEIDDAKKHTRKLLKPADYMTDIIVEQLDGENMTTATYEIYNAFPSTVSSVELADETADTISEFTTTFSYSHWERIN